MSFFSCVSSSKTCLGTDRQTNRQTDSLTVSFVKLCLENDRSEQVRIGKDWLGMIRTGQDGSGIIRNDQDWSGLVRTGQDRSGLVRNGQE